MTRETSKVLRAVTSTGYQKLTRQYGNSDISPQIKFKWILLLRRSITVKEKENEIHSNLGGSPDNLFILLY